MTTYSLGIDTGGTYTDAVLMQTENGEVVAWSKERTTPHDLSIGVGRALAAIFRQEVKPENVARVAVSTTLATNAVVEDRGARVGLFVFGHVRHFKLPVVANIFLKGGHTITGEEDETLDLEGLVDTLAGLAGEIDSYAVCGAMSIKNPAHELVAREAINLIDPKPVFCSHQVSSHPGMLERSATACLHAKLMPLMTEFLASIQRSMLAVGLFCPVTIILGNGRGADLEQVVDRAAVTMASGPAATARFGAAAVQGNALVVDVGGTTTDVCLIREGVPQLNHEGCVIGEWRTHVEAVDMYTSGTGGDSQVVCQRDGTISLKKTRVQPLAMTANLPDPSEWLDGEFEACLILPVPGLDRTLLAGDQVLAYLDRQGPATPRQLAQQTGLSLIYLEKKLERLAFLQQIVVAGFTPTDALHGLGILTIGDGRASCTAASILAQQAGLTAERFCRHVVTETEKAIEGILLTYLCRTIWAGDQAVPLLDRRDNELFSMHFSLKLPLIGIGAAARCFLPGVAQRLGTTVSFPRYCEVGNAVGAAQIGLDA
ncbi:hydantoinase/oxoprolinase N-terminal domain-containing protein [Desulfobulbus alkaliphilus]|uniref:hydantoinase/oxoprolinase N-terminal domain-containing protein n=1 Tax=Desulfobulbus alkaliphilus TaxID=869814 RepID=UPI0019624A25|nr:hydantoinase/oxoprolinase family protein [Desulfobulbus alkaliphilus]MBM9538183.1 hydantoinase/oxoprolinase family protein [Desulfobulbus alkaliphilus]